MSEMAPEFPLQQAQQVIVPAYVWADELQRIAICTQAAAAMISVAHAGGYVIDGDVLDVTSIDVTPMQAQVGAVNIGGEEVRYVAYERCEPALADLIFAMFTAPLRAAS